MINRSDKNPSSKNTILYGLLFFVLGAYFLDLRIHFSKPLQVLVNEHLGPGFWDIFQGGAVLLVLIGIGVMARRSLKRSQDE